MRADYTHIEVVMDKSGSMASIKSDTEGGFNAFMEEQKALPGTATITLTEFSSHGDIHTPWDMIQVQDAPAFQLKPTGNTALLDAIGRSISRLGQTLADMPEETRPEKVIFVIVTDGEENDSREFTLTQIHDMITHQTEVYGWTFIFLGANQDAIQAGHRMGVSAHTSMSYAANAKGVASSYGSVSQLVSLSRSLAPDAVLAFSDADRSAAMGNHPGTAAAAPPPSTFIINP